MEEPKVIPGGLGVDDRGEVIFVNSFQFKEVKRFYIIGNHQVGYVRAWHAHKKEAKYIMVVCGAALVGAAPIDNWDAPSKDAKVFRYVLSVHKPSVLYIPAGYANGAMSLTDDAKIIYFSTGTFEEAQEDDFRYHARYWDIWNVEER